MLEIIPFATFYSSDGDSIIETATSCTTPIVLWSTGLQIESTSTSVLFSVSICLDLAMIANMRMYTRIARCSAAGITQ